MGIPFTSMIIESYATKSEGYLPGKLCLCIRSYTVFPLKWYPQGFKFNFKGVFINNFFKSKTEFPVNFHTSSNNLI